MADWEKFVALVLWMRGHTLFEIAEALCKAAGDLRTADQVWGYIRFSGYPNRRDLNRTERQSILNSLLENRLDDGRLSDYHFKVI